MTPEQSLALVEYIAHLSVEDWNGIARDLRKLGFVPAGMQPAIILVSCQKKQARTKIASSSASFPFKDLSCFHALFAACLQASSSSQKVLLHALCVANHMRKHLSPCRSIICVAIWWLPVMATRQPLLTGATALCTRVRCIRLHDTVVTGHH